MAVVSDVYAFLDGIAPFETQMGFDNAGFLAGHVGADVTTILVVLDITEPVIHEAVALGAQLIVSHHPVIFNPVRTVTDRDPTGRTVLSLLEHKIAAICVHTNLDLAVDGVNDALATAAGLTSTLPLTPDGLGRIGVLSGGKALPLATYAAFLRSALHAGGLRVMDAHRPVHRVAVGGGSCGDLLETVAAQGCDTFVTADVKHNMFLTSQALGLNLIDAGHFATENVICPVLVQKLTAIFPDLRVCQSKVQSEPFIYL